MQKLFFKSNTPLSKAPSNKTPVWHRPSASTRSILMGRVSTDGKDKADEQLKTL